MVKKSSGFNILLLPEMFIFSLIFLGISIGYLSSAIVETIKSSYEAEDLLKIAIDLCENDKNSQALDYLYKADKLNPNNPKILFQIAYALFQINQSDQAVEKYALKTLEINKSHSYANLLLGAFYQNNNQHLKSLLFLKRVDEKRLIDDEDRSYTQYLYGLVYKSLGDQESLTIVLERLKQLNASDYVSKLQKED